MAEYPCNFTYQSEDQTLYWEGTDGALEYQIEYTTEPQSTNWLIAYSGGNDTQCTFDKPPSTYAVKGKSRNKDKWDIYGPIEYITINP